ncbi:chromate efflux transporter [Marinomonas sp. IMCC 4694]|uniref:chromate efflux transporter n=1 Tax=Marinomonas sp. IMCC 4694 TaxID=2605432 RepID=UPI0011E72003|nr:chromate efflux transporter [Marinomonas sp. IMCC 4694]TYL46834.1 chromate efflux transporter [Marinomonas sp. IMCC 4694]
MSEPLIPSYGQRLWDVFVSFLLLGFTSFGGPAAHLGYFNQTFIQRKKWATEAQYAQWMALSQVVPGPGSSQVGFALGYHRAGWLGAWAAFVGFTLPSFVLMVLLAQFSDDWQDTAWFNGVIHGLKLLAVVVVADACVSMWRSFCKTYTLAGVALASAVGLILAPVLFPFISVPSLWVLLLVGLVSAMFLPVDAMATSEALPPVRFARWLPVLVVGLFASGFVFQGGLGQLFAEFYQAGVLVFGGGHVVLPMLSAFVSDRVASDQLLVGYAAAQAVPGPMFTMASFLGASSTSEGAHPWLWAGVATLAVFLSGLLLMLSMQNVWQQWSHYRRFRAAVRGINAAVVGVLLAALYHPIGTSSLLSGWDIAIVAGGFVWLNRKRPSIFSLIFVFVALQLALIGLAY